MVKYLLTVFFLLSSHTVRCELPNELDPFMDKLFETEECEDFISGDFTAVATTKCDPHMCDFPRQLCVRPASRSGDSSANQCKTIPTECITSANGGRPVGPPQIIMSTLKPMIQPGGNGRGGGRGQGVGLGGEAGPRRPITVGGFVGGSTESIEGGMPAPQITEDICEMGAPSGRFCGFKVMYTYNKETQKCDEFWFPGCVTQETNANLFEDLSSCQKIVKMCRPASTTTPAPPPPTLPPPPPPPPEPIAPFLPPPNPPHPKGGRHGGGKKGQNGQEGINGLAGLGPFAGMFGNNGGGGGAPQGVGPKGGPGGKGGNGDEEDLGLFGLIQKGLVSAQAIKQGGPKGKEAAAAAAGQLLQQFTGFDLNNIGGNFGNFFNGR